MKILSFAWVIYDEQIKEFANNCTGGGLVIKNICEYIGRKEESYLFIGKQQLPQMKLGNIHVVETDKLNAPYDGNISATELHLQTMCLNFRKALDEIKPDIVNFHGIGELMLLCMDICNEYKIPYVFTEHLYIGLHKDFDGYDRVIEWEKLLYQRPNVNYISVSTGMKKKILNDFPNISETRIKAIVNGTDFNAELKKTDIEDIYKLYGKKVLLCVGTIVARKNQMQLVRAFQLLPQDVQEKIVIIFCGNDTMKGKLQEQINEAGLADKLIYVGGVSSEKMKEFYTISDGLAMPSRSEGLSIAALEAIAYGNPVILYKDSECADDLYDEDVVCFAKERTDDGFAEAILDWFHKDWDKEYIKKLAENFTMEKMADEYIKHYRTWDAV